MATGTYYRIVGAADCPRFARTENIGRVLQHKLDLSPKCIQIERYHPEQWLKYFEKTCEALGFLEFFKDRDKRKDQVLVWNPHTGRLLGGAKEFRKEIMHKYTLGPCITWSTCVAVAQENLELYNQQQNYIKAQKDFRESKKLQLIVTGPPCSGKTTHCKLLNEKFGVVVLSPAELISKHVKKRTKLGKAAIIEIEQRLPVPDSVLSDMLCEAIESKECKSNGFVLDISIFTEQQALDLEATVGVDVFINLSLPDANIFSRADDAEKPKTQKDIISKLRPFQQNIPKLKRIFEEVLFDICSDGTIPKVHDAIMKDVNTKVGFDI